MVFLILICASLLILPLAAQRNDFKRMMLIAIAIEALKYLIILIISPVKSEFINTLFVICFYIFMLPEMMAGGEFGPGTIWGWVGVFCVGVVWNLIPAYFIPMFLPEKTQAGSMKATEL